MRVAHGVTGRPVSRAHRVRRPQASASTSMAASRLTKNSQPRSHQHQRTTRRATPAITSFKPTPAEISMKKASSAC